MSIGRATEEANDITEALLDVTSRRVAETMLELSGGGLLIFDDLGQLKYHVYPRLFADRQAERLGLWDLGLLDPGGRTVPLSLAALHARRSARVHEHL